MRAGIYFKVKKQGRSMSLRGLGFSILLGCVCVGCGSQDPGLLYRQSQGSYQKAVSLYQRAIAKRPQALDVRLRLAEIFVQQKQYRELLQLLVGQTDPRAREYTAVGLYHSGDPTGALEVFERLEKESHCMVSSSALLYGKILEEKNLFDKALSLYSQVYDEAFKKEAAGRIKKIHLQIEQNTLDKETQAFIDRARKKVFQTSPGAVILKAEERIEVTADNREVSKLYFLILIKEERAKEDFGEIHIPYDSTYEKVNLHFARTINPDGQILTVGKKNIRDVTKYLNYPLYSNAKVMIISMPEVKVGSIIEYEAEITSSKLIADRHFSYRYTLRDKYPIIKASFVLEVPRDRAFHYKILNAQYTPAGISLQPAVQETAAAHQYSWQFQDIPEIKDEPGRVPTAEVNPMILVSSFSEWQEVFTWWDGLYRDKLAVNSAMKAVVKEITARHKEPFARAEAIYEFCATQIRYVGVEYGEAGHMPHRAEDIFQNRYGDCKDQAILLVALLREAGFPAYPVLIPTKGNQQMQEDFPAVLYNHAIAAVEIAGAVYFMDTTAAVVQFTQVPKDDQNRTVLIFTPQKYLIAKTPLIKDTMIHYVNKITLKNGEDAVVDRSVIPAGLFGAFQRAYYKYTEPYVVEQDLQEKIKKRTPLAELIEYHIDAQPTLHSNPVLKYRYEAPRLLTRAGIFSIVPVLNEIRINEEWIAVGQREYPLDLQMLQTVQTTSSLSLPPALDVVSMPSAFAISTEWFDFSMDYQRQTATIYFTESLHLKKTEVSPSEYREFKKQVETVLSKIREPLILQEKKQ